MRPIVTSSSSSISDTGTSCTSIGAVSSVWLWHMRSTMSVISSTWLTPLPPCSACEALRAPNRAMVPAGSAGIAPDRRPGQADVDVEGAAVHLAADVFQAEEDPVRLLRRRGVLRRLQLAGGGLAGLAGLEAAQHLVLGAAVQLHLRVDGVVAQLDRRGVGAQQLGFRIVRHGACRRDIGMDCRQRLHALRDAAGAAKGSDTS